MKNIQDGSSKKCSYNEEDKSDKIEQVKESRCEIQNFNARDCWDKNILKGKLCTLGIVTIWTWRKIFHMKSDTEKISWDKRKA